MIIIDPRTGGEIHRRAPSMDEVSEGDDIALTELDRRELIVSALEAHQAAFEAEMSGKAIAILDGL